MSSGALSPGFPPIEIEGEHYWGGALVPNTPLRWVVDNEPRLDTLAFPLWNARGDLPQAFADVWTRQKETQYSSHTHASTDFFKYAQPLRRATADLLDKSPKISGRALKPSS